MTFLKAPAVKYRTSLNTATVFIVENFKFLQVNTWSILSPLLANISFSCSNLNDGLMELVFALNEFTEVHAK